MSLSNVQSALITKWVAVNALLTDGPWPCAYPNQAFEVPANAPWARLFILANQPFVGSLGDEGEDEVSGILQIDLHTPLGEGTYTVDQAFNTIRAQFKAGTYLSYGGQWVIILSCGITPLGPQETFYKSAITIEWETRLSRA